MPVSRSRTSIEICPFNKRNHSTRSLPWVIGRMYSSVVGQNRLYSTAETISGFHVTSFRARYSYRLSKPNRSAYSGLIFISPSFPRRSWNASLTGCVSSVRWVLIIVVVTIRFRKIAGWGPPRFRPKGLPVSPRRGPRIEIRWDPVLEDRLERGADLLVREHLAIVLPGLLPRVVVLPEEHVDAFLVEVERAEDLVELHHAVEEVPADVPLDRAHELADGDVVLAARIADDREVRVPLELVAAEAERLVPEDVRLPELYQRFQLRHHRHSSVRQISSHAYVSHSLCFVCKRTKDFFGARIRYATRAGKEARLPSRRTM